MVSDSKDTSLNEGDGDKLLASSGISQSNNDNNRGEEIENINHHEDNQEEGANE